MAPILFPLATKIGIHPVHLGILMIVNTEVGLCHPPVGLNLYIASSIAKMGISEITMPPTAVRSPSFVDIASRPTTTALSLKQFLRSNHSRMPRFILSRADTDDVVAYILSIKPK